MNVYPCSCAILTDVTGAQSVYLYFNYSTSIASLSSICFTELLMIMLSTLLTY